MRPAVLVHGRKPLIRPAAAALALATVVLGTVAAPPRAVAHLGVDEQIAIVSERLATTPDDVELLIRRAELHRVHRDWDAARADLERAREVQPRLEAIDLSLGATLLDSGDPAGAVEALDRFLTRRPGHVRALMSRARAASRLGRFEAAVADYDAALAAHDPDARPLPDLYLERARAAVELGPEHVGSAIAGLDAGLARLGQPVTLQLLAIELEQRRGDWDGAIARVQRLIDGPGRDETWLLRKASIEERCGRAADARESYRRALAAIDALPAARRRNRAVERMEHAAREGLARLDSPDRPDRPDPRQPG